MRSRLRPLSEEEEGVRAGVERHITMLSEVIGERHVWRPGALEASAKYIEDTLRSFGLTPEAQTFRVPQGEVRNIEVTILGERRPKQIYILGAHYDSVECPAANDNASGVAGVLEAARLLAKRRFRRTVRLVFFVNEEPPFYKTKRMGSWVYAEACAKRGDDIRGMINLETIGCYSEERGSQRYPYPLNKGVFRRVLPERGNFVAFVGDLRSWRLTWRVRRLFRRAAKFPSLWIPAPASMEGPGMSDHWCFWQQGYPAVMVTDTAFFRYDHYHKRSDRIDKLNLPAMARVVTGVATAVAKLAGPRRE